MPISFLVIVIARSNMYFCQQNKPFNFTPPFPWNFTFPLLVLVVVLQRESIAWEGLTLLPSGKPKQVEVCGF